MDLRTLGGTDKMDLGTLGVQQNKMDLRTLGVQIKWILEHWGTDKMDLGTLGVQIKWILEHWGYR